MSYADLIERLRAGCDTSGKPIGRHMVEGMTQLAAMQADLGDEPDAQNLSQVVGTLAACIGNEAKLFDDLAAVALEAADAIASLEAERERLATELSAAIGYMMNARIDLETGCTKQTAIKTISGGIGRFRAALHPGEKGNG